MTGSGGRRTCNDGIGISIVKAKGFLLGHWHQCWQGQQDRTCTMQGTYVDSNGKEIGVLWHWWQQCGCQDGAARQEQGDDGMALDWHRQGEGNAMMALPKR